MGTGSDGKSQWRVEWEAAERKRYSDDPAIWLREQFANLHKEVRDNTERHAKWQTNEAKEFIQTVGLFQARTLMLTRHSLILWLGILAMIALASARLWVGVGGLVLAMVWQWYSNLRQWKFAYRLDSFRSRFRYLMTKRESAWDMPAEDKAFLEKCEDSILYPTAVTHHRRELLSEDDLEEVEALYREYCSGGHFHPVALRLPNQPPDPEHEALVREHGEHRCPLCMAKRRVKQHIDGVLSKVETYVKSARQTLVTRIDASNPQGAIQTKDFLEEFREWEPRWFPSPEELDAEEDKELLKSLRDKQCWTFEEADKVHELCRRGKHEEEWESDSSEPATKLFDKLSPEMKAAAAQGGLEQAFKDYDGERDWLFRSERSFKDIRRTLGRRNPEAMFREMEGEYRDLFRSMGNTLRKWGWDAQMVEAEVKAARKLMDQEGSEKNYRKELEAAKAFAWIDR